MVLLLLGGSTLLASCTAPVTVEPAPSAADAACSEVMLTLPQAIDGKERHKTTSQSTAAWGDPAAIVFRCGTQDPGPTSDPCTTVDGVDWVAHENEAKNSWTLTAYGRVPGLQVTLDDSQVTSAAVATALTEAARKSPATKRCTSVAQDEG